MPTYQAPLRDQQFVIHELLQATEHYAAMPAFAAVEAGLIDQVLEENGRFAAEVLFPLNASGDLEGCKLDPQTHTVTTPAGFRDAWRQFTEAGWAGLAADADHGGQGLPHLLYTACSEMQCSANGAWAMYAGLTYGAYECLRVNASEALKSAYLPALASGRWAGTMCLTEPQCGTDLGLIRTRAEPADDGSYRLQGTKIFISAGEHDLAENIVHLVLARLPDAPEGSRGISLFVVPKFLPDANGEPGQRNGITCARLEDKMGIHANATCEMQLDGATGFLVGEANQGLPAMFVMMNGARLSVGIQGLGFNEVAYQNAVAYAHERRQGRSLRGAAQPDEPADSIFVHPDVRRMLLTARAYAEGGRALSYWAALLYDQANHHPDSATRQEAADFLALVTPVVKAFLTDNAFAATVECQQVFGGHGYIREHGMEQYVRDARISMIYEGTNTIQALDLLGRKVLRDQGAVLKRLGKQIQAFIEANGTRDDMNPFITPLADLAGKFGQFSLEIGLKAMANPDEAAAAATPYLRVAGHLLFAWWWARAARIALEHPDDPFYQSKLAVARFYFVRLLPEAAWQMQAARSGSDVLMALDADRF